MRLKKVSIYAAFRVLPLPKYIVTERGIQMKEFEKEKKNDSNYIEEYKVLAETFIKDYNSVVELDLNTGIAFIYKSSLDLELEKTKIHWEELVERYASKRAYSVDCDKVRMLSLEYMINSLENGLIEFPMEVRCIAEGKAYDWSEIKVSVISHSEKKVLVMTRVINEIRILKSIIELFVYQTFDYLILLDIKNDSYIRFSGDKNGIPLPPVTGEYTKDMIEFNKKYVLPEDMDRVTESMQIPHVIKMLEKERKYVISSGAKRMDGSYRRTRVQFLYYDKMAGLVLLSRNDVTQIYLEEQKKEEQLNNALKNAKYDGLTRVYNHKAIKELIICALERQYRNMAAFLFIDVDNFKMVNDTLGHQMGDKLLCYLADSIKKIGSNKGMTGRIGGDEYLLFLPQISSRDEIESYANKICSVFQVFPEPVLENLPVSCSVGISIYPQDGIDYETLVRKADQALYSSKRYGKNRYYFYSEELS